MTSTQYELSFRTIGHPPQTVYMRGQKVGRVERRDNGWASVDLDGMTRGFALTKAEAGRILARWYTTETSN